MNYPLPEPDNALPWREGISNLPDSLVLSL